MKIDLNKRGEFDLIKNEEVKEPDIEVIIQGQKRIIKPDNVFYQNIRCYGKTKEPRAYELGF